MILGSTHYLSSYREYISIEYVQSHRIRYLYIFNKYYLRSILKVYIQEGGKIFDGTYIEQETKRSEEVIIILLMNHIKLFVLIKKFTLTSTTQESA